MNIKSRNSPLTLIIDDEHAEQRIDNYLFPRFKSVPKSLIYKMLRKGSIRVNKKRTKPDYRLKAGDILRAPQAHEIADTKVMPDVVKMLFLEQRILFEDDGLLIIDKPSGLASHGGSGISFGVIEAMRRLKPKLVNLELAHRLDRATSGCLILAKKRSLLQKMHELLRDGKLKKTYLVLVKGKWEGGKRIVETKLQKNVLCSGERKILVAADVGKISRTTFIPKKIFAHATLLEVKLHTGRMHQIRAHAAHIGHPVAGDEKYGDFEFNTNMKAFGLRRLFLHAAQLEIPHMNYVPALKVDSPLPKELISVLELLAKK